MTDEMSHHPTLPLLRALREDWVAHWRELSRPGFQALAVYRLGHWAATARHRNAGVTLLQRVTALLQRLVRHRFDIDISPHAHIGRRVQLGHQGGIAIGAGAVIGDECIIHQGARIGDASAADDLGPRLGHSVLVGARAVIGGPVRIGAGARIGPNAVVAADVGQGGVAIAPPAILSKPQPVA